MSNSETTQMALGSDKRSSRSVRTDKARKYGRDVLTNMVGRNLQFLITLVAIPIVARSLGPVAFAQYSVAAASYFFGSALLDMGMTSVLAGRVATADQEHIVRMRTEFLWMRIFTAMIIVLLGLLSFLSTWWLYVWIGLCAGAVSSSGEEWLLIARGNFGTIVLMQWCGRTLYLLTLIVGMAIAPLAFVPMVCLGLGNLLTSLLSWRSIRRRPQSSLCKMDGPSEFGMLSAIVPRASVLRGSVLLLRTGVLAVLTRFSAAGYTQSSALLASLRLAGTPLGLYAASDRALRAVQGILDSFVVALLPRMARSWGEGNVSRRTVSLVALGSFGIGILAGATVFVSAPLAVSVMYGSDYSGAVVLLRLASAVIPVACLTSMLTSNVLQAGQRVAAGLWVHLSGLCVAAGGVLLVPMGDGGPFRIVLVIVFAEIVAAIVALVLSYRACATISNQKLGVI